MGADRANDHAGAARRSAARRERPRGAQRNLLCSLDGLPVVGAAQGPAAEVDGTSLLHAMGLERHARAHPPRALCGGTRPGRARGEPIGGGDRQPERQGSAKRGASLDPQGFDAGKKVTGRKLHILVDTLGLLLSVIVHPADVQDRDGARELTLLPDPGPGGKLNTDLEGRDDKADEAAIFAGIQGTVGCPAVAAGCDA